MRLYIFKGAFTSLSMTDLISISGMYADIAKYQKKIFQV